MDIVYMSGVWDLFHIGHLNAIRKASQLGSKLIIGVVTDKFCEEKKEQQPIIPFRQRCAIVNALQYVDAVEPTESFYDFRPMEKHGVTLRAVGPEFENHVIQKDVMAKMISMGYKIVVVPYTPNVSTTLIKQKVMREH